MLTVNDLRIETAYQTKNRCYKAAKRADHVGVLVHSTGAVNRNICRYVDAPEIVGINKYGNHWNKEAADKCMHGFVGYDKNQDVIAVNTLPYSYACWGCGKGSNGSYNYNPQAHIQFEICQGSDTDSTYYWKAINAAVLYVAYLCKQFGFTADNVCSHKEAAIAGYASNHGDPESWMKHFGDNMTQFRTRVAALLDGGTLDDAPSPAAQPSENAPATVRKGDKGEAVNQIQALLIQHGYSLPKYGADGDFGGETLSALIDFQRHKGLDADGICGALTWAALKAVPVEPSAPDPSPAPAEDRFVVTIPDLDAATATYLLECYPQATSEKTNG